MHEGILQMLACNKTLPGITVASNVSLPYEKVSSQHGKTNQAGQLGLYACLYLFKRSSSQEKDWKIR